MRNSVQNLSENAQRLYGILVQTGGGWEDNLMEMMFPKPAYASNPEARAAYWQYESNAYGHSTVERPLQLESEGRYIGQVFAPNVEVPYRSQLSHAYQELRKAGLAGERNNGFNCYYLFPKR
jgi:hypothetical protein